MPSTKRLRLSLQPLSRAAVSLSLLLAATPSHAALQALGHEFRPTVEERTATDPCVADDGTRASVVFRCNEPSPGAGCPNPYIGKLWAEWRDSSDQLVGEPVLLAEGAYNYAMPRTCLPGGAVVAALLVPDLVVADQAGVRGTAANVCGSGSCFGPFGIGADDAGFLVDWSAWGSGLYGRRFDGNAAPLTTPFAIAAAKTSVLYPAGPGLAVPDGILVAWVAAGEEGDYPMQATVVHDDGSAEPAVTASEFPYVSSSPDARLRREDTDRFVLAWNNAEFQGGWVARRLSTSDTTTTTTSTTTTTLEGDLPAFLPSVELGPTSLGDSGLRLGPIGLVRKASQARWLAEWPDPGPEARASAATSTDDARHWSAPSPFETDGFAWGYFPVVASNAGGSTTLAAWVRDDNAAVLMKRSADGGQTWTDTAPLYVSPWQPEQYFGENKMSDLTVVAGAGGRWVAAWTEYAAEFLPCSGEDPDCIDYDGENVFVCALRYATSSDDGATWSDAGTIQDDLCYGRIGLQLANDGDGNWFAAWLAMYDGEVHGAGSTDDAASWSPSSLLFSDLQLQQSPLDPDDPQLALGASGDGDWLLAFPAYLPDPPTDWPWTHTRIFVSRASGVAGPWSPLAPLAPWHDDVNGYDRDPSIAVDSDGRFGLAWSTQSSPGGGLDADIVAAFSDDGGEHWSAPRLVDEDMKTDSRLDVGPRLVADGPVWAVAWWAAGLPGPTTLRFAKTAGDCGNGALDPGEACDDGNLVDGDGCDSSCLPTGCGSYVVTGTEECDDGNTDDSDSCIDCHEAYCGDGIVRIGVEECDDANSDDTDGCLSACTLAVCGDGALHAGAEACDDGTTSGNNDACLSSCTPAACGDGYLHLGKEDCDDGNLADGDGCSKKCRLETDCGFLNGSGLRITASDALKVLKRAVGVATRCPLRNCDANHDGAVTAADSLWTLRSAVGLFAPGCSWPDSFVVRLGATAEKLGALQVDVDYSDAAGHVLDKAAGGPDCEVLDASLVSALNDVADRKLLRFGLISLPGFQGPMDLLRCRWDPVSGPSLHDFRVTVVDASNVSSQPIDPSPAVTVTVE